MVSAKMSTTFARIARLSVLAKPVAVTVAVACVASVLQAHCAMNRRVIVSVNRLVWAPMVQRKPVVRMVAGGLAARAPRD